MIMRFVPSLVSCSWQQPMHGTQQGRDNILPPALLPATLWAGARPAAPALWRVFPAAAAAAIAPGSASAAAAASRAAAACCNLLLVPAQKIQLQTEVMSQLHCCQHKLHVVPPPLARHQRRWHSALQLLQSAQPCQPALQLRAFSLQLGAPLLQLLSLLPALLPLRLALPPLLMLCQPHAGHRCRHHGRNYTAAQEGQAQGPGLTGPPPLLLMLCLGESLLNVLPNLLLQLLRVIVGRRHLEAYRVRGRDWERVGRTGLSGTSTRLLLTALALTLRQ